MSPSTKAKVSTEDLSRHSKGLCNSSDRQTDRRPCFGAHSTAVVSPGASFIKQVTPWVITAK